MALRFGFWNIAGRPISPLVRLFAECCDLDMMFLAEIGDQGANVASALSRDIVRPYRRQSLEASQVQTFSRLPPEWVTPRRDDFRSSFYTLAPAVDSPILVVAVHLPSQLHRTSEDQSGACRILADNISREEESVGHRRTLVIGDFNANPFDDALMLADSLQAISDRRIVRDRASRVVDARERRFFYNCMWRFLGDHADAPPGTYFYDSPKYRASYWNAFDQILLRPCLVDLLVPDSVRVITTLGEARLGRSDGRPCKDIASDHFPIVVALNLA